MIKRKFGLLNLFVLSLITLSSCGGENSSATVSSEIPSTSDSSLPPGPEGDDFIVERDQLIKNLTLSNEEYERYRNKEADFPYTGYSVTNSPYEFLSRDHQTYVVNDKNVDVDLFYIPYWRNLDHPNNALGLLLYKAILYKLAYPEEENEIYLSSFHYSIIAGVNLVKKSRHYGTMKSMPDDVIDSDGYVRFSYLTYFAAKIGIKIALCSQLGGYSNYGTEILPEDYYPSIMEESCAAKYGLGDKKIKDYMNYVHFEWYAYDDEGSDKAATDMMHNKFVAVKHYLGDDGKVHDYAVLTSSSNLDGIHNMGVAGCVKAQTGALIVNHEYIYRCFTNFTDFSIRYPGQHEVYAFRSDYKAAVKAQREIIKTSGYDSIKDEMMIYLGTPKDKVFELYFGPLDTDFTDWTDENPICKYVNKLTKCKKAIKFYWINPKFATNSTFLATISQKVIEAFKVSRGQLEREKCYLMVKSAADIGNTYDELVVGTHLGGKDIISNRDRIHQKDFIFEYEENNKKCSTMLLTTANTHMGGLFYQINTFLVINETEDDGMHLEKTLTELYKEYEL